ncbi:hypothetical protein SCH4B_3186 [Ruegeria sp. TrichCH4B]|nr:hypothetical protein SCH4B_3186 [Ruegeria sp. TrichCH4B]
MRLKIGKVQGLLGHMHTAFIPSGWRASQYQIRKMRESRTGPLYR